LATAAPVRVQAVQVPRLSVVVPAYNEAAGIGDTIRRLRAELASVDRDLELLVADDGSADGTADAAEAAGADQVLRLPHLGKGAAVRAGMAAATGRTIGFIDADLAYGPDQLVPLLEAIEKGADVAVGSRRHSDSALLAEPAFRRRMASVVFARITRFLQLDGATDTQAGIKAFSIDAARAIFPRARVDGFAFDVEMFVIARTLGLSVVEVPVRLHDTAKSSVRLSRHTLEMLRDLAKIRSRARRGGYSATR
jgi:glycosyltransferase involved in cell wall biosynthesis